MNEHTWVLKAQGLKKAFDNTQAVKGVDLELRPGECLALLGPNGAGKTTTCEMLEGLIRPDSGSIEILGMNLLTHHKQIMEQVGIQLQETNLYKRFTVRETLELFSSFYKKTTPVDKVLEDLNLNAKSTARMGSLSGGQHQRVALACALVNQPEVLFLDEPTTGLDPNARRDLWEFVAKEKKKGTSILLTTHYMEEAETLADRVAIMDGGSIIASGSPTELIHKYCGLETISIQVSHANHDIEKIAKDLESELPWISSWKVLHSDQLLMFCKNSGENLQSFMGKASLQNLAIHQIAVHKSHLEDVFVELTGKELESAK